MNDEEKDELTRTVGSQFVEIVSSIMVHNIMHFYDICKSHGVEESKLSSALSQYITEARINGIKVPKPKGIKNKSAKVSIGDPTAYLNKKESKGQLVNTRTNESKRIMLDRGRYHSYNGITCYVTNQSLGNIILLADDNELVVLGYNENENDYVVFDEEDREYLVTEGYRISPYA